MRDSLALHGIVMALNHWWLMVPSSRTFDSRSLIAAMSSICSASNFLSLVFSLAIVLEPMVQHRLDQAALTAWP
jgi:hypothetical protein